MAEIFCSISASALFQTSYILDCFDLLLKNSIARMDRVFHRFLGEKFCGVIGERENRGGDFHMKKVPSKIVVENCLKIVEK